MIPGGGLESNERWLMNITYEKAKEEDGIGKFKNVIHDLLALD